MLTDVFIGLLNGDNLSDSINQDSDITTSDKATPVASNNSLDDTTISSADGTSNATDSKTIDCMGDNSVFSVLYIENL